MTCTRETFVLVLAFLGLCWLTARVTVEVTWRLDLPEWAMIPLAGIGAGIIVLLMGAAGL